MLISLILILEILQALRWKGFITYPCLRLIRAYWGKRSVEWYQPQIGMVFLQQIATFMITASKRQKAKRRAQKIGGANL
jgi:hypothetical protein